MRCLCQVSSYESSYVSIGDCFAALLKSSCHSAWGGGGRGATALPFLAATSAASPVACDRGWALPNIMTVSLCCRLFLSHFSSAVGKSS